MRRVAALVDLEWRPTAGGHVKCWERLAAAAARRDDLDLTVFFSGKTETIHRLSERVRYIMLKPVFSTARFGFLSHVPDHTDLAPYHWGLAGHLRRFDLIHTTDGFFNFARTAAHVSRRTGIPLTNSIHTDTPSYAEVFTARTVERLLGAGALSRLLLDRLRVHERARTASYRKLAAHHAACRRVLVSKPEDLARARAVLPDGRVGWLRRGIETEVFDPARRDRAWLLAAYGIPENRVVVVFAGRLNRGKSVLRLAEAVRARLDAGDDLHLLCAGAGEDRLHIQGLLGDRATCPGAVAADLVARFDACGDVFAFPSEIEINANVPMEAQAAGLPTLVSGTGGAARAVIDGETGLVLPGDTAAWAEALGALSADPARRRAMGAAARTHALADFPSWDDVLGEDLMPVWTSAIAEADRDG